MSDPQLPQNHAATTRLELTAGIVSAFVSNNAVPTGDLPKLIANVHATLGGIATGTTAPTAGEKAPAVSVKASLTPDYLICLEDGKRFKSLKRHLAVSFGLTPAQYRAKWDLPDDYPMVAPNYAASRSSLAKALGLGQKRPARAAAEAADGDGGSAGGDGARTGGDGARTGETGAGGAASGAATEARRARAPRQQQAA